MKNSKKTRWSYEHLVFVFIINLSSYIYTLTHTLAPTLTNTLSKYYSIKKLLTILKHTQGFPGERLGKHTLDIIWLGSLAYGNIVSMLPARTCMSLYNNTKGYHTSCYRIVLLGYRNGRQAYYIALLCFLFTGKYSTLDGRYINLRLVRYALTFDHFSSNLTRNYILLSCNLAE